MQGLDIHREGWDEIQEIETRLLQQMTVRQSVAQWLALQQAFEVQLQETEPLFAAERRAAMVELQERLQRPAEWQSIHEKPV